MPSFKYTISIKGVINHIITSYYGQSNNSGHNNCEACSGAIQSHRKSNNDLMTLMEAIFKLGAPGARELP